MSYHRETGDSTRQGPRSFVEGSLSSLSWGSSRSAHLGRLPSIQNIPTPSVTLGPSKDSRVRVTGLTGSRWTYGTSQVTRPKSSKKRPPPDAPWTSTTHPPPEHRVDTGHRPTPRGGDEVIIKVPVLSGDERTGGEGPRTQGPSVGIYSAGICSHLSTDSFVWSRLLSIPGRLYLDPGTAHIPNPPLSYRRLFHCKFDFDLTVLPGSRRPSRLPSLES